MAFPVEKNGKLGTLVWVQRKNGTWWPGKIEFSCLTSGSRVPVQLLGKEDGALEWFNLQKSKRIKPFRSAEFEALISCVESSQTSHKKKCSKYAHRQDAVLHALLLEKQEQEKGLDKEPGELKQGALSRGKRSRCAYLPVESENYFNNSLPDSQLGEEQASSESTVSDTFQSSLGYSDSDGDSRHANGRRTRIRIAQKKRHSQDSSGTSDTITQRESCVVSSKQAFCQQKSRIRHKFAKKSHVPSASEVNLLYNSTSGAENSGSESLCQVNVTVLGCYPKAQVPLVSLRSTSNNVAIIGHPVEVEVLETISEDSLSWRRTFRRTPVSYNPIHKSAANSNPEGKEKTVFLQEEESLLKPQMEGNVSLKHGQVSEATCVPVNLIFSKLFSAISA